MGFVDLYYSVFLSYKLLTYKALPEIWRLVTPFLITGPQLGLILDPYFLYTYGSQLELECARFSQPGDFFVYIMFVCTTILVSPTLRHGSRLLLLSFPYRTIHTSPNKTSYICPANLQMVVAVPGNEGDYPCTVQASVIRKIL